MTVAKLVQWMETLQISEGGLQGQQLKVLPFQRRYLEGFLRHRISRPIDRPRQWQKHLRRGPGMRRPRWYSQSKALPSRPLRLVSQAGANSVPACNMVSRGPDPRSRAEGALAGNRQHPSMRDRGSRDRFNSGVHRFRSGQGSWSGSETRDCRRAGPVAGRTWTQNVRSSADEHGQSSQREVRRHWNTAG